MTNPEHRMSHKVLRIRAKFGTARSKMKHFILLLGFIVLLVTAGACGKKDQAAVNQHLTKDEQYLINSYARIIHARDLHSSNPAKAESLFAVIDSTTDTLRIANTINSINKDPNRWIYIFEVLENRIQRQSNEQGSENSGRHP
jgi:hypothetical protein